MSDLPQTPISRAAAAGQRYRLNLTASTQDPTSPSESITDTPGLNLPSLSEDVADDTFSDSLSLDTSAENIKQLAISMNGNKRLKPETEELFEKYQRAPKQRRLDMIFCSLGLLQERLDQMPTAGTSAGFEITNSLKTEIKNYTWKVALSPFLPGYKHKLNVGTVVTALRKVDTPGIPAETSTADLEKLKRQIRTQLNTCRHEIKALIFDSLQKENVGSQHITTLASSLAAKGNIIITAAFAHRLAILRRLAISSLDEKRKTRDEREIRTEGDEDADLKERRDDYWDVVDKKLLEYSKRYKDTPSQFQTILTDVLGADMKQYPRQENEEKISVIVQDYSKVSKGQRVVDQTLKQ